MHVLRPLEAKWLGMKTYFDMAVSCIVPNYNHAAYLRERLDSILAQTRMPDEILLLDDCSTDSSREILEAYAARHPDLITCHFNATNSGSTFAQWNKGAELAKGDYLWIAESDDVAEPTFLDALLRYFADDHALAIAYCESAWIDPEGNLLGPGTFRHRSEREAPDWDWGNPFVTDGETASREFMGKFNAILNVSAAVIDRKLFFAAGAADTSFRLCGDWHLYLRILKLGGLAYTPEVLNRYRSHPGNVRATTLGSARDDEERARVAKLLADWLGENN